MKLKSNEPGRFLRTIWNPSPCCPGTSVLSQPCNGLSQASWQPFRRLSQVSWHCEACLAVKLREDLCLVFVNLRCALFSCLEGDCPAGTLLRWLTGRSTVKISRIISMEATFNEGVKVQEVLCTLFGRQQLFSGCDQGCTPVSLPE